MQKMELEVARKDILTVLKAIILVDEAIGSKEI
ncbi:hypothetical protein BCO_0900039 (plasmid) [Borrelia coriaceae ATCC 43381]|uniref:Uncharacterized protein n=1 Tax=Borrelia coriaceae ATCC 43381 TaxID=1408429 RepID=W5SWU5_9SPIR|nr:hypothetical protein BCO_0900039 [Borrelia coriaceae ATCC 43381]